MADDRVFGGIAPKLPDRDNQKSLPGSNRFPRRNGSNGLLAARNLFLHQRRCFNEKTPSPTSRGVLPRIVEDGVAWSFSSDFASTKSDEQSLYLEPLSVLSAGAFVAGVLSVVPDFDVSVEPAGASSELPLSLSRLASISFASTR